VRAQETVLLRRVNVFGFIGVGVVVSMVGSPPQWAALYGAGTDDAENELSDARSFERAMREIAVIKTGDREHAYEVTEYGD
jgi:hypothetical protein